MEEGPSTQDNTSSIANNEETDTPPPGCVSFFFHPLRGGHRFIFLVFLCFLGFGSYFCYDSPASLKNHIKEDLNLSDTQFNMLYSLYSWPNVFMCFIGGYLIDRVFGIRWGTVIFMGLTFIGQIFFSIGAYADAYWLMLVGRFVFGIGAESLAVGQNNYAVLWFKGKELNMVFGLQLSFARIGSTINLEVMDGIYNWVHETYTGAQGMGIVLFIATVTCVLSMICALVLYVFDRRADRILKRSEGNTSDPVKLTDIFTFKPTFWLLAIMCVTYYVAIFPFVSNAQTFFDKFNYTEDEANKVAGIVYLISGVASPFLGFAIDKLGNNIYFIIISMLFTILAHGLYQFTMLNPYYAMSIMGVAYSALASSLWPLVSLIIPENQLGTAYGMIQAIQNLGLAVMAILVGIMIDHWGSEPVEIMFIICLFISVLTTIALYIYNWKTNGILNMTPGQRTKALQNATEVLGRESLVGDVTESTENLTDADFHVRNSLPPQEEKETI